MVSTAINMNKYVMIAATAIMFISSPALACGGKSCSPKQCAYKVGHTQKYSAGDKSCAMGKQGHAKKRHARFPGKTSNYIRKILHKGELIGLSDTQRKQVTDLLVKAETGTATASIQTTAVVAEFYGRLRSGGVSDDEIKAYAQRMGELRAAHLQANLMSSVHAAALLSNEQKTKLYASKKSGAGKK
jgi:Spy/CpxP family protein refolding chaperone